MTLPYHITMEGEKQGKIEGTCEILGRERSIIGYWFMHKIEAPHRPVEGTITAGANHGPLKVIIERDECSPKLHQALCTGERMKYVQIDWYHVDKYGDEYLYLTMLLKDALIVSIHSYTAPTFLPDTSYLPHMEKVSFSYKYIRWTYHPGGIEAEDPYVKEYGKNPLKDIGCALRIAGMISMESKKIAIKDTIKNGVEGAIAGLLTYFEAPWLVKKVYDDYQKITKEHEINENATHGFYEKARDCRHKIRMIKDETYGHKK